jgi:HIRAN domain.
MRQTFVVRLRGGSYENTDGSHRQELVAECRPHDQLHLKAEPDNPHDRHAIAVFDRHNRQLGYLPSDARDASSILRGEGITAHVEKLIGGPRWWHRLFGLKRHRGLLIRLDKASIDRSAHNSSREIAIPVDDLVAKAIAFEKASGSPDVAISNYQEALRAVVNLNRTNPVAAAHRFKQAPINRLTMLLVRHGRPQDAIDAYNDWTSCPDPIGITKGDRDSLAKRMAKISAGMSGREV